MNCRNHRWHQNLLTTSVIAICCTVLFLAMANKDTGTCTSAFGCQEDGGATKGNYSLRIAFIGSSSMSYNDFPHMVQSFLLKGFRGKAVEVGACLQGGVSLATLWTEGVAMNMKACTGGHDMAPTVEALLTSPLGWDVVIIQDDSQGLASPESREQTMGALRDHYVPLLRSMKNPPLIVLHQTWDYLQATNGSEDIGDFSVMIAQLVEGYVQYAALLEAEGFNVKTAPSGQAFAKVRSIVPDLWQKLYQHDNAHPMGMGSFLSGTHIATVIAENPQFSAEFPHGLRILPAWLEGIVPFQGAFPPAIDDLATVLSVAGPSILQRTTPEAPRRIIILGSSVSTGEGASKPAISGWPAHLSKAIKKQGFEYVNQGLGGTTVNYWQEAIESKDASHLAGFGIVLMSLSLGNEGLAQQQTTKAILKVEQHYLNGLLAIVRKLRAKMLPRARLVIGGPYPNNDYNKSHLTSLNRILAAIRSWEEVDHVLDFLLPACHDGHGHWHPGCSRDSGHPNDRGHKQMFACVQPAAILGPFWKEML